MAGRKQHHIPQLLLRRFATTKVGKTDQIWVFRKDGSYRSSIRDVAAERHFYSKPASDGAPSLDDNITTYEDRLATKLNEIDNVTADSPVDPHLAAEVITHLTVRNAHFRRSIGSGLSLLLDRSAELFCDEDNLRNFLGLNGRDFSPYVRALFADAFAGTPEFTDVGIKEPLARKIAFILTKERFRHFFASNVHYLSNLIADLSERAPGQIRDGHNNFLSDELVPDKRMDPLTRLKWRIHYLDQNVILPDCVAISFDKNERPEPLVLSDISTVSHVVFPVSNRKVLVGSRDTFVFNRFNELNEHLASCGHDFFVASQALPEFSALSANIGSLTNDAIEFGIKTAFDDFLLDRIAVSQNDSAVCDNVDTQNRITLNWPVSFRGVDSHEKAEKIASFINVIIRNVQSVIPLDRLDGLTFASDYEAALLELERGFDAARPLTSTVTEYGTGVAMAPTVLRDGLTKRHLLFRMEIGDMLVSEDEELSSMAMHLFVQQLALVSCTQLVDETLPGVLLTPISDILDSFLHPFSECAWSGYFSARISAAFRPESYSDYRDLVIGSIRSAQTVIKEHRMEYRFTGDLDRLLEISLPKIGDIICHLATLLGHSDSIGGHPEDDGEIIGLLSSLDLEDWVESFHHDLSGVWNRRGQWASYDELLMTEHAERVMWSFGMFPWKTDDGSIRVEVPISFDASDLAALSEDKDENQGLR